MLQALWKFVRDETGATAVEYALIIALISGVVAVGATLLGIAVTDRLADMATKF